MRFRQPSVQYLLLAIAFYAIGLLLPASRIVSPVYLRWSVGAVGLVAVVFNVLAVRAMYARRTRS